MGTTPPEMPDAAALASLDKTSAADVNGFLLCTTPLTMECLVGIEAVDDAAVAVVPVVVDDDDQRRKISVFKFNDRQITYIYMII